MNLKNPTAAKMKANMTIPTLAALRILTPAVTRVKKASIILLARLPF